MAEKEKLCPNCGHCPTCGRSNRPGIVIYPGTWPYPYTYPQPWWGTISPPYITYSNTPSNINTTSAKVPFTFSAASLVN